MGGGMCENPGDEVPSKGLWHDCAFDAHGRQLHFGSAVESMETVRSPFVSATHHRMVVGNVSYATKGRKPRPLATLPPRARVLGFDANGGVVVQTGSGIERQKGGKWEQMAPTPHACTSSVPRVGWVGGRHLVAARDARLRRWDGARWQDVAIPAAK